MMTAGITADLTFKEAAKNYLKLRSITAGDSIFARYIKEGTEEDYAQKLASAELFFGERPLREIHWPEIRAYQLARVAGAEPFVRYRRPQDAKTRTVNGVILMPKGKTPCPAKPKQVNQETRLIKKLKSLAGCWTDDDEKYYQRIREEESDVDRALEPYQQKSWLDAAGSRERWERVYWWSLVSFDLICSPGELRSLQLGHVNLNHQMVRIPWPCAKNPYRRRDIPIESPECLWALEQFKARAHDLGAKDPQHYLFPFIITRKKTAIADQPMSESGLKKLWQEVREATGLKWFRMEDTRHTGATRMAESGVPAPVIMARMGHSNLEMQQHYQHIADQAQRMWMRQTQQLPQRMPPRSDHGYPTHAGVSPNRLRAWGDSSWPIGNFSQKRY